VAVYVTSVVEITEAGIVIRGEGEHLVRVLGALPRIEIPSQSGSHEQQAGIDPSVFGRYHAGEIQPPPLEAGAPDEPFTVPDAVVTASGQVEFLKRGGVA